MIFSSFNKLMVYVGNMIIRLEDLVFGFVTCLLYSVLLMSIVLSSKLISAQVKANNSPFLAPL